ncbi:MAG: ATP-dependent helicase [Treponema sp.]|jgi:DNA helicase-2/ATP-dependent DNA helicase PcrA|nr:ATP-dependent helicase [Treponema sp.]
MNVSPIMPDSSPHPVLPPYLEALNEEQRAAVFHSGRSLLILAGAGSGKTRVITTKIAYLIREQGVDPRTILAVTFTNKAAREMADRARLIDGRAGFAILRTFHSFGAWFLRRHGSLAGLDSGFIIYDDDDTASLLGAIMEGSSRGEVREAAHHIARAKDYFLSPDDPELTLIDHRREFRRIYRDYEERLAKTGNVDFGDLIKKPVEILRNNPAMAERFRSRFKVIMVDEYQDANVAQFELLKEIRSEDTYVCVVGDDDQSIYRFRGAEVRNILEFPERFPGTDIIRLERNYRSLAPILSIADSVVNHNEGRLGKTLIAVRGTGKKPVLAFLPNQDEEVMFCAELIEEARAKHKVVYADWAILYRTNAQSLGFETEFLRRRIPYRVVGSLKFYEREEIKDALALLALLVNPRDEVAFCRVVNKPARGIGAATVKRVVNAALAEALDFRTAAERLTPKVSAKAHVGFEAFFHAIEQGRATLLASGGTRGAALAEEAGEDEVEVDKPAKTAPRKRRGTHGVLKGSHKREDLIADEGLSVCVVTLLMESGIAEYHLNRDEIAGNQRISNLQELANAASLYHATEAGLLDFLEHIELDRSPEDTDANDPNKVTLITLHNTKGLEFRRVIMTGVEQGVFPREDKRNEELEEERRLFYVGATRAMDQLYLSTCALRRMYGHTMPMFPSVFLHEIDREGLRIVGDPPYAFSKKEYEDYDEYQD